MGVLCYVQRFVVSAESKQPPRQAAVSYFCDATNEYGPIHRLFHTGLISRTFFGLILFTVFF